MKATKYKYVAQLLLIAFGVTLIIVAAYGIWQYIHKTLTRDWVNFLLIGWPVVVFAFIVSFFCSLYLHFLEVKAENKTDDVDACDRYYNENL